MDKVLAVFNWIQANWVNITTIITSIIGAASIIVKLTPTLKDDTFLLKVIKFLAKYVALNVNTPENRPQ